MKAKFGSIVVDGRGKLGGHFLSKNIGGNFIATKANNYQFGSNGQLKERRILTYLSKYWRNLTETQRLGWNSNAKEFSKTDVFGDVRLPSGFNAFYQINWVRYFLNLSVLEDAPLNICQYSLTEIGLYVQTNPALIQFNWSPELVTNMSLFIWASRGMSPGLEFDSTDLCLMRSFSNVGTSSWNGTSQYTNRLGTPPPAGARVWAKIQIVDNSLGTRGNSLITSSICVSL